MLPPVSTLSLLQLRAGLVPANFSNKREAREVAQGVCQPRPDPTPTPNHRCPRLQPIFILGVNRGCACRQAPRAGGWSEAVEAGWVLVGPLCRAGWWGLRRACLPTLCRQSAAKPGQRKAPRPHHPHPPLLGWDNDAPAPSRWGV